MPVKKGEVYVLKGVEFPNYAVVVESVQKSQVILWDTGSVDTKNLYQIPSGTEAQFSERYQLATEEQVARLLTGLRENLEVISQKICLLKPSAQTLPSCIDEEPFDFRLF